MITLTWPSIELSPNSRFHWAVKAKRAKAYREAAGWATKAAKEKVGGEGMIDLHITFYPPDNRRRDGTNMLASLDSALNGIADALESNIDRFHVRYEIGAVIKGGEIRIILSSS